MRFEAEGSKLVRIQEKSEGSIRKTAAHAHPSARRTCVVQHGIQVLDCTYLQLASAVVEATRFGSLRTLGLGHLWSLRRLR